MRVRREGILGLVSLLAACGYRGGSFTGPHGSFSGERVTVGCLDVAVAAHADAAAEGPAIAYEFGNRCDRAATVDLGAVVVRGRTVSGREITLAVWDPYGQLRSARLEARRTGREVLEYRTAIPEPIALACVELDGLDGPGGERREVCIAPIDASGARVAEVAP